MCFSYLPPSQLTQLYILIRRSYIRKPHTPAICLFQLPVTQSMKRTHVNQGNRAVATVTRISGAGQTGRTNGIIVEEDGVMILKIRVEVTINWCYVILQEIYLKLDKCTLGVQFHQTCSMMHGLFFKSNAKPGGCLVEFW